jgi:hypothetical protein
MNDKNAKRARFLLKVFLVRHVVGVGMFVFLTISAFQLGLAPLALGAGALTLLYLGVAIWMGLRLRRSGQRP